MAQCRMLQKGKHSGFTLFGKTIAEIEHKTKTELIASMYFLF